VLNAERAESDASDRPITRTALRCADFATAILVDVVVTVVVQTVVAEVTARSHRGQPGIVHRRIGFSLHAPRTQRHPDRCSSTAPERREETKKHQAHRTKFVPARETEKF
jgi:hypothetical protein